MTITIIAWPLDDNEVARLSASQRKDMANEDGFVVLEHGALPNKREGGGFVPIVWENGRQTGSTWAWRELSREEAEQQAKADVEDLIARHGGDWVFAVGPRRSS